MKKILYLIISFTLAFVAGCSPVDKFPSVYPPKDVTRVLFVYMAMDESTIYRSGLTNIVEMVEGATHDNMNAGQIIVFSDSYDSKPRLIRVFSGTDGIGHMETLIEYPEDLDSSDPATLKRAFEDMKKHVTGTSYALAFGSHGTGWMPQDMLSRYCTEGRRKMMSQYSEYERIIPIFETRAMFPDTPAGSYMELPDFAATITELVESQQAKFDYILFDLCYMGGIEVAYALRNATDWLVVSPAEVVLRGMPYDRVMHHLFADVPRLGDDGVCKENIAFYTTHSTESATMSLIDCTKLDRFAEVMQQIIGPRMPAIYERPNTYELPHYDRNSIHTMFDIKEFVLSLNLDAPLLAEFNAALDELVLSKQTTGKMFTGITFDRARYSGLTTYVPVKHEDPTQKQDELLKEYKNTEWFKRVYAETAP